MEKNNSFINNLWMVLGILLGIVGLLYFLWHGYNEWNSIRQGFNLLYNNIWIAVAELFLMIINVILETWRWRIIDNSRLHSTSFLSSLFTITESIAMSSATPVGIGEHIGKIRKSIDKKGSAISSVLGSVIQTGVIIFMGFIGIAICSNTNSYLINYNTLFIEVFILIIIFINAFLFSRYISKKVKDIFKEWTLSKLIKVTSINILRYLVFAYQMYLMVTLNFIPSYINIVGLIMVYYMIITIVPSSGIVDMGIRGSVATSLLGIWGGVAAIMIWIINRVVPGIFGALRLIL